MTKTYYKLFWAGVDERITNGLKVFHQKSQVCHPDKVNTLDELKAAYRTLGFSDKEIAIIVNPFESQDYASFITTPVGRQIHNAPSFLLNEANRLRLDGSLNDNPSTIVDLPAYFDEEKQIAAKLAELNRPVRPPADRSRPRPASQQGNAPSAAAPRDTAQEEKRKEYEKKQNEEKAREKKEQDDAFQDFKTKFPEETENAEKLKTVIEKTLTANAKANNRPAPKITLKVGESSNLYISVNSCPGLTDLLTRHFCLTNQGSQNLHVFGGLKAAKPMGTSTLNFSWNDPIRAGDFFDPLRIFDTETTDSTPLSQKLFKKAGGLLEKEAHYGFYASEIKYMGKCEIDSNTINDFFDFISSLSALKGLTLREDEKNIIKNFVALHDAYKLASKEVENNPSLSDTQKTSITDFIKTEQSRVVNFMKQGNNDLNTITGFCSSLETNLNNAKASIPVQTTGIFKKIFGVIASILTLGIIHLAAPRYMQTLFGGCPPKVPVLEHLGSKLKETPNDGFFNVNI